MSPVQPHEVLADPSAIADMGSPDVTMRALFDALSARAAILDGSLRIVATNTSWDAAATRLGVRGSTVLANFLDVYEWRSSDDSSPRAEVAAGLAAVLEGRQAGFSIDFRVRDGFEWIRLEGTRIGHDARPHLLICQTDHTAGPEYQDELSAALAHNRRLAMVVEQTEALAMVTDPQGRVEWANAAFLDAHDTTLEAVQGLRPGDIVVTPGDDDTSLMIEAAVEAGQPFSHLREHIIKGEPRWFQVDAQPVIRQDLVVNYVALHRDVTELMHSRAELAAEERLLSTIIDSLPVAVWWKDADLRVVGSNQTMRDLLAPLGITDPVGHRFSDPEFADCPEYATIEALESTVLATGERIEQHQMTAVGPGGDRTRVLTVVPLHNADGSTGVMCTETDTTDVHAMEQALADGTRLEAIGQLAAGVAHEINTPIQYVADNTTFLAESFHELIQALDGLTEIARAANPAPVEAFLAEADLDFLRAEIPGALDQAADGLARVAEIVRAMKEFSHPGTELGATDLNSAVEGTVTVSRSEWKFVADVELDLDPALPAVLCHEGQIKQVVLNLVVNAAHAIADSSDGEKGTITIQTAAGTDEATIRICDTGCGMPAEVQQRIFEPFFTTKEVGRGTGQGLAMAHKTIVQGHGGTIEVSSTPGEGTTFTLTLPYQPDAAEGAAP